MADSQFGTSGEGMIIENLLRTLMHLVLTKTTIIIKQVVELKIDLILEGDFGLLPIEIKYGQK